MPTKNKFDILSVFKCVNITVFLVSFLFGLVFIYYFDDKKKINVYPTPSNYKKIEYRDKAENCYEYSMEEVECPKEQKDINNIPIQ